ncbi:MAG: metal-dependent hydrolase [Halobacteriales archaeon]
MWPWGHLALGYLVYSAIGRYRRRPRRVVPVVILAVATQLADLIDKPLAWSIGVLDAGRSLGHSAIVAGMVVGLIAVIVRSRPGLRAGAFAFGVGHVSHLLGDIIDTIVTADLTALAFLWWPFLSIPPADASRSIIGMFLSMAPTPFFLAQLVLTVVATVVWIDDGCSGLAQVGTAVGIDRCERSR